MSKIKKKPIFKKNILFSTLCNNTYRKIITLQNKEQIDVQAEMLKYEDSWKQKDQKITAVIRRLEKVLKGKKSILALEKITNGFRKNKKKVVTVYVSIGDYNYGEYQNGVITLLINKNEKNINKVTSILIHEYIHQLIELEKLKIKVMDEEVIVNIIANHWYYRQISEDDGDIAKYNNIDVNKISNEKYFKFITYLNKGKISDAINKYIKREL